MEHAPIVRMQADSYAHSARCERRSAAIQARQEAAQ